MIYPENFEHKIGFAHIRELVANKCLSPLGERESVAMHFSSDYDEVMSRLSETNEFLQIIRNGIDFPLNNFVDVTSQLAHIRIEGTYLLENDLFNLKRSVETMNAIKEFIDKQNAENESSFPYMKRLINEMDSFPVIVKDIDAILDKFGNIKDNASPKLREIKKMMVATVNSINGILRRIISDGRQSGILEKDITPTMRDGRLVIPVAPMNKRKIKGIVHDESATGKTVFIEPAEIVEANNNIREYESELKREIIRILIETTGKIRPHVDELLQSYDILGKIDFIRGKAIFANEVGGMLPHIDNQKVIEWYHAVHPGLFLSLKMHNKDVVPLNILLDDKNRILMISGPNAGGKSVCLKTVGIIQYMTQCGMLPPVYENSHIGIFDKIFIDIGDEQSIEDDLSTYSSHLTNMKYFLANGNESTIILIDEFGGGTEPQIGGAIAQSLLQKMNEKNMFGVITTHYQNLKHFAEDTPGIINGAMLYDRQKMQPLFQLSIGYPGSSFAIEIARKIGLPSQVISSAEEIVGSEYINMDKYILDIARDRRYWENKRHEIRLKEKRMEATLEKYNNDVTQLEKEHKEILKAAKMEAKEILSKSNAAIERTIYEIKKVQAEKNKTKEIRRQIDELKNSLLNEDATGELKFKKVKNKRQNIVQSKASETTDFVSGDFVSMDDGTGVGTIISVEGKSAIVAFGNLKTKISLSRLKPKQNMPREKKENTFISTSTSDELRRKQLEFKQDIDVRGMRADEALQAITYFLDDAIQFNAKRVRILHGTGTGILRQRLREYIDTISAVKSYRDEHVQFGGAGITVVELD